MLRLAFQNLRSRPARSLLALSGLTVAIIGMVGLYSVAGGIDRLVSQTFGKIPGVSVIQSGAPLPLFSRLPAAWGPVIAGHPAVHTVSPEVWTRANLIEDQMAFSPPRFLFGIDIATRNQLIRAVYRDEIVEGRFLDEKDRGTWNTVISRTLAGQYGKQPGDFLRVDGRSLRIVGIYDCGSLLLDIAIVLDIDRVRELIRMRSDTVCSFYVEPRSGISQAEIIPQITSLLKEQAWPSSANTQFSWESLGTASLVPGGSTAMAALENLLPAILDSRVSDQHSVSAATGSGRFEVRGPEQWEQGLEKLSTDLDLFLLLMTSLGVTIALLSILNTMLMSVSERFGEFGILKANGWSSTDILKLITLESAMLGLVGGILGAAFGWCGTHLVNAIWSTRAQLYASPSLLLFSLGFSLGLGILGGLYPALRAAGMSPMESIRKN